MKRVLWLVAFLGLVVASSPLSAQPKLGDTKAHRDRGMIHWTKGEFDKAIADYTEAIRLNPKYAEAFCDRGIALETRANMTRSAEFTEAIHLNPKYAEAYCHRGNAHETTFDHAKAIADYTEAIRLNPKTLRRIMIEALPTT